MNYKIELTAEELQLFVNLLDIAVRSGGLKVAKDATSALLKLEQAEEIVNQPELKES